MPIGLLPTRLPGTFPRGKCGSLSEGTSGRIQEVTVGDLTGSKRAEGGRPVFNKKRSWVEEGAPREGREHTGS